MDREKAPVHESGGVLASFGAVVCGKALTDLREKAGLTQDQLAALLGRSRSTINAWENGGKQGRGGLTPAGLLEIAPRLGYTAEDVLRSLRYHQGLRPGQPLPGCAADPFAPTDMEAWALDYNTLQMDGLVRRQFRESKRDGLLAGATEKLQLLLTSENQAARLDSIRISKKEYHDWSLSYLCCQESIKAAADDAKVARELAELAVAVANRVALPWKDRLSAYALAHLANAYRVPVDLDPADVLYTEALALWEASPKDPGILDPGFIYAVGAALRREQRRFSEAIDFHDRTISLSWTPGRYILQKAFTLEQMGRHHEALANLDEADKRLLEREPRDEFLLSLNRGVNLCHLEQFRDAAPLAVKAMEVADGLGNKLDWHRAEWLHARVKAGEGDLEFARSTFARVRRNLASKNLFYDTALVSAELSNVSLRLGRFAEAAKLAAEAAAILKKKKVYPEALAAVRLFVEAFQRNAATVELGRKLVAFLYRAKYDRSLVFSPPSS